MDTASEMLYIEIGDSRSDSEDRHQEALLIRALHKGLNLTYPTLPTPWSKVGGIR